MVTNVKYDDLDVLARQALDAAEDVMEYAYNPYSHFYVGAALFGADGIIVPGTSFETANYNSICAERTAIVAANTRGMRNFLGIAVIGRGTDFESVEVVAPCGACRQMLHEVSQISQTNLRLILSSTRKDKIVSTTINELMPLAFGPIDLGIDVSRYGQTT